MQVDSRFDPGNSGGPVIQVDSGRILGVATCAEITKINYQQLKDDGLRAGRVASYHGIIGQRFSRLKWSRGKVTTTPSVISTEKHWLGFRLDSVPRWETIDSAKWQAQLQQVNDFRLNSFALVALIQGRFDDASRQPGLKSIIAMFQARKDLVDPQRPDDPKDVVYANEFRDLLTRARAFAEEGTADFSSGSYYDFFRSSPNWASNVGEQVKFRAGLVQALADLIQVSRNDQSIYEGWHDKNLPPSDPRGGI
jgi:hypothetical protein